jgi:hypothetical protein
VINLKHIALFEANSNKEYFILAGELLNYDYDVKPMTRDFSPANQVIKSFGGQTVELRKEESSKLLEAIIYSDFLGISNDKPNGLIQTEVSKRININTYRSQGSSKKFFNFFTRGVGWVQYVKPSVTISKIEENNRYLFPISNDSKVKTKTGGDSLITSSFTSPINVLQYQNLSLGIDLNLLIFESPTLKFYFYANGGFRFGRTSVRDSLRTLNVAGEIVTTGMIDEYIINNFTFYPEVILQFLPEERFSLTICDRIQYFLPSFSNPGLQTIDKNMEMQSTTQKVINSIEVMANVKTGTNGKIFARWRFNSQWGNLNQNFSQVQVGYSFYLLKKQTK